MMKMKNRFLLILLTSLLHVSCQQIYAVKLSTIGKATVAFVFATMLFELEDGLTVYQPLSKFEQSHAAILPTIIESSESEKNNTTHFFLDQIQAGHVDHAVILVNPMMFNYKGLLDRRETRIRHLFEKAQALAPTVIMIDGSLLYPFFLSLHHDEQIIEKFMQAMQASKQSVIVDETLVAMITEPTPEKMGVSENSIFTKRLSREDKNNYLQARFQSMQLADDIDISLIQSLMQDGQYNVGQLINFVSHVQDLAQISHTNVLNFKHFYKARYTCFMGDSYAMQYVHKIAKVVNSNQKKLAYHESARALLHLHHDSGRTMLGISILPHEDIKSETIYACGNRPQTNEQKYNQIMASLVGGAAEQKFEGKVFKTRNEGLRDLLSRETACYDRSNAYSLASHIVHDNNLFVDWQTRQRLRDEIVQDAYSTTVAYVHEHASDIDLLAQEALRKEVLSVYEIRNLVDNKNKIIV